MSSIIKKPFCIAIIVAAGKGTRMGMDVPKTELIIDGKPIIIHTLEVFEKSEIIDDIVLVTAKDRLEPMKGVISYGGYSKVSHVVAGGEERTDSVYNGIKACQDIIREKGAKKAYIFIHDGARPYVSEEIIERAYEEVVESDACVVGVPAKDTIKIVNDNNEVESTPNRNKVWMIQTPQVFEYNLIKDAYEKFQIGSSVATDDSEVVELMTGHPVKVVMGDYANIKITTREDIPDYR